jgi:hypothetical protein
MARLIYKPFGLIVGVLGGLVARKIFKRVWGAVGHEDEAPKATDASTGWREVVLAAAAEDQRDQPEEGDSVLRPLERRRVRMRRHETAAGRGRYRHQPWSRHLRDRRCHQSRLETWIRTHEERPNRHDQVCGSVQRV